MIMNKLLETLKMIFAIVFRPSLVQKNQYIEQYDSRIVHICIIVLQCALGIMVSCLLNGRFSMQSFLIAFVLQLFVAYFTWFTYFVVFYLSGLVIAKPRMTMRVCNRLILPAVFVMIMQDGLIPILLRICSVPNVNLAKAIIGCCACLYFNFTLVRWYKEKYAFGRLAGAIVYAVISLLHILPSILVLFMKG